MVIFLVVASTVWLLAHFYVSKRLFPPWRDNPAKRRAKRAFWILAPLAPLTMMVGRFAADVAWLAPFKWLGFVHMGFFFLLFCFLVFRDIALLLEDGARRVAKKPVDPERRRFLENASNAGIVGASGVLSGWGLYESLVVPTVVEVDVPLADLPPALDGFRIVQLSDIHVGPTIRRGELQRFVDAANALEPDLIVVTGDLVDGYVDDLRDEVAPLGELHAPEGVFFCTGNHEYYWDAHAWIAEVARLGVTPLINEHRVVQRDGASILMAGCTDYSAHRLVPEHRSDPAKAIEGAPAHDVSILLAHQPKSADAAFAAGFDLQLSGHTHGGQFFPVLLFVGLVHPFSAGLGEMVRGARRMWVYVNRGTGYWGPPQRAGVPAEITVLRLVREAGEA